MLVSDDKPTLRVVHGHNSRRIMGGIGGCLGALIRPPWQQENVLVALSCIISDWSKIKRGLRSQKIRLRLTSADVTDPYVQDEKGEVTQAWTPSWQLGIAAQNARRYVKPSASQVTNGERQSMLNRGGMMDITGRPPVHIR